MLCDNELKAVCGQVAVWVALMLFDWMYLHDLQEASAGIVNLW
jgi:hypothetical protein